MVAPTVGSVFTGIGGIDLGLERAGFRIAWQCEIDPYCRRVLQKHWPTVPCFPEVHEIGSELERVDVIAGGFPCQPVSTAGLKLAQDDERWLWPQLGRLVGLLRPRAVLLENVPGLLARGMGDVVGDLAALGYDAEWDCISASAVGAPHRRDRVWILAYPHDAGLEGRGAERELRGSEQAVGAGGPGALPDAQKDGRGTRGPRGSDPSRARQHQPFWPLPDTNGSGRHGRTWDVAAPAGWRKPSNDDWWAAEPDVGRVAHGVPARVDRLRALGNACVPQVVEHVGYRLREVLGC